MSPTCLPKGPHGTCLDVPGKAPDEQSIVAQLKMIIGFGVLGDWLTMLATLGQYTVLAGAPIASDACGSFTL